MSKNIDADFLKAEIEKRKNICKGIFERDSDTYYQGKAVAYQETLSFIDSLQQEEEWEGQRTWIEQPSEDLEEAAEEYEKEHTYQRYDGGGLTSEYNATLAEAFIAGAEWKEEQDDKETADLLAIAHLQGMEQQKKEMMKEVTECELVCFKDHLLAVLPMKEFRWTAGDKVKIIIVKED